MGQTSFRLINKVQSNGGEDIRQRHRQTELAPEERECSPTSSKAAKGHILERRERETKLQSSLQPVLSRCHGVTVSRCYGAVGQIHGSAFLNGDATGHDKEDGDLEIPDLVAAVSK